MNRKRLFDDLVQLSHAYTIAVDDDYESIIVKNFNLPPGYNRGQIPVMLMIPSRYPESAPGIGKARVYVPEDLRYQGKKPEDFHDNGHLNGWAWWCYEWIEWNPCKDNLVTFFEMLRAHMTNPELGDN